MAPRNPSVNQPDTSVPEAFERLQVPVIFGPWSRDLVDAAGVEPGDRLLDIGCGTGPAARYAAERVTPGGSVAAIDRDAVMIAYARTLYPPGEIDWRVGDVMALPFGDAVFDVVVGNQVLQFFNDKAGALAEIRRVLARGGRLGLNVYCGLELCPGHAAVERALAPYDVDLAGIRVPYGFGDAVALGDVIQRAGFRDVAVVRRFKEARFASPAAFVDALVTGSPSVRHSFAGLDADALRRVIDDVTGMLADYMDESGVRIVTTSHVAIARS